MAKQSDAQKETVERVMHAFQQGELEQRGGEPVKNPRQAIAIALHEAGASNQESPPTNRRTLARTKAKERRGETARDAKDGGTGATKRDLYARARKRNIPGRSRMSKAQLAKALD